MEHHSSLLALRTTSVMTTIQTTSPRKRYIHHTHHSMHKHSCKHQGAKRAKEIKAQNYVECTSKDPQSVGKVVMDAVNIVLEADKLRKKSNEKQYKQELKKEEKDAKKVAKQQKQQRNSVSIPGNSNGVDKGKQPEITSSS